MSLALYRIAKAISQLQLTVNVDFNGQAVLSALLGVDGSGSGLDADLLDGQEASDFLPQIPGTIEFDEYANLNLSETLNAGAVKANSGKFGALASPYVTGAVLQSDGPIVVSDGAGGTLASIAGGLLTGAVSGLDVASLADNATMEITTNKRAGWLVLTNKLGYAAQCGIVAFRAYSGIYRTNIVLCPNNDLGTAVNTASKINVYGTGTQQLTIQNKTGGTVYPVLTLLGEGN